MVQVREHCCVRLLGVLGLLGTLLFALASPGPLAAAPSSGTDKPEVTTALHHDTSPPLRDLPDAKAPSGPPRVIPLRRRPTTPSSTTKNDPVVQSPAKGAKVGTIAGLTFPGVGQGDYGYSDTGTPPDTNGAVGATQYVQWVNTAFAVFNKSNGALVYGPANGNTLWSGFGGDCETNNDGDPIVLYDHLANRWFFTQFSVRGPGTFQECVAVSQTSDATGAYYQYAFAYASNEFNDYPKVGIWPDGYYITYNIFDSVSNAFLYAKACAFDRTRMLSGLSATQQCFNRISDFSLLPSDLDGTTAPSAGSPNFLLELDNNNQSLDEFKFHVDWTTPGNSTLTGPVNIPVAPFTPACGGSVCVPQPGTTNQLDSLADRLMYRLAYRNFGDHESLVVNHSVTAGGTASGVRWYEIRSPNGTPTVFQQQTYGDASSHRWMGSIAMDKFGDMALGYSMSSSTLYPQIAYTGRRASDPLSTMQGESVMKAGAGSELTQTRWGDYSAMTVDPVDDCTFWYTNEYWKASGDFSWSTQIASFSLCGAPAPSGLQYYPLAKPVRLLDTRAGATALVTPNATLSPGQTLSLPGQFTYNSVTIPPTAQAIIGNATVANNTNGTPAGFATIFPSGVPRPLTSNLNFVPGTVRPNNFTVALGSDGRFNLYSLSGGDFVIDLTGYYAPAGTGGLYFHPLSAPVRELDTRSGATADVTPGATLTARQTLHLPGSFTFNGITVPASAKALVGNATVANNVNNIPAGFATLYPDDVPLPLASNLNFVPGTVAPNGFTVALGGGGGYNLYTSSGGDFVIDITGYLDTVGAGGLLFTPLSAPVRELDTRAGGIADVTPGATLTAGQTLHLPGAFSFNGITVPASAKALVGNATVANDANNTPAGFATLYPDGVPLPLASNLNFVPKQVAPNGCTVGVGADGNYALYTSSGGDFVIDITGYFS